MTSLIFCYSGTTKADLSQECLYVLLDFVEEFDLVSILPLLSDDMNLSKLSNILRRAVRLKIHQVIESQSIFYVYACTWWVMINVYAFVGTTN